MKIAICGSRTRTDRQTITKTIDSLPRESIIISGGCRGVDTWAIEAAKRNGMKTIEFLPDLAGCSKKHEYAKAYYARNKQIAELCDILFAFVSPKRKGGTENTIAYAKKAGKKIFISEPGDTIKIPHTLIL